MLTPLNSPSQLWIRHRIRLIERKIQPTVLPLDPHQGSPRQDQDGILALLLRHHFQWDFIAQYEFAEAPDIREIVVSEALRNFSVMLANIRAIAQDLIYSQNRNPNNSETETKTGKEKCHRKE